MSELEQLLRSRGYRLTNQRRTIVRELEGSRHLSAEEIYDRVKGGYPELGLSTVYRTLDLLHELEIVRKEDFGEGYSRYELVTERMHHHARCRECGKVIEFNEELMEYLALQVERETGFVTLVEYPPRAVVASYEPPEYKHQEHDQEDNNGEGHQFPEDQGPVRRTEHLLSPPLSPPTALYSRTRS